MIETTVFNLLEDTKLNWSVNKIPLQTEAGAHTDSFGLFRNDNGRWLGTVGKQYIPYQNSQLAETLVQASEGVELNFNNGGQLSGGKKIYLQAELEPEYIGKSEVKRYITALNSHDGTTSIAFGSSSTVVICQNTFFRAYRELQKFRHTTTAQGRIDAALSDMREAMGLDRALMNKFKRMAKTPLDKEVFANVLKACFDADVNTKPRDISTRKRNQLESINKAIEEEISLEGATLWGLFNGITRYTNHVAVKPDEKTDYLMTGGGYKTNGTAFDEIMKWIEANTGAEKILSYN